MAAETILLAPVKGLAVRYITVDACGNITDATPGPASKETVFKSFTKVESKPTLYEGDEIKVYNADGTLDFVDKPLPYTEYDIVTLSMARRNPKLIPQMTGAQSVVLFGANAHVIGISEPTSDITPPNGGTLEVWSRNGGASGCGDDPTAVFPYIVHVWQWTKNWVDKTGVIIDKSTTPEVVLEGQAYANPNFGGGPHDEYGATALVQPLSGHRSMVATASAPPAEVDAIAYVE